MKVRRDNPAFTLVELLIVLGVIVLLVGLVMPSLRMAREQTAFSICQSNLKRLVHIVHAGSSGKGLSLPSATDWLAGVIDRGGGEILRCPKDNREAGVASPDTGGIDELYIKHEHVLSSPSDPLSGVYWIPLAAALSRNMAAKEAGNPTTVTIISNNEKELYLPGMGSIRVYFGLSKIRVSIGTHVISESGGTGSNHYLYQGSTRMLLRLRGMGYKAKDPYIPDPKDSVEIPWSALGVSYGMNDKVPTRPTRLDQLMLMEWSSSAVMVTVPGIPPGNFTQDYDDVFGQDKELYKRHFGKINVATTEGQVRTMTRSEVDPEANPGFWSP